MASDYQSSEGERNEVNEVVPEETSEISSSEEEHEEGECEFEENDGQEGHGIRQSIDGINIEEQELGEAPAEKKVKMEAESP